MDESGPHVTLATVIRWAGYPPAQRAGSLPLRRYAESDSHATTDDTFIMKLEAPAWSTRGTPYPALRRQKVCSETPMRLAAPATVVLVATITSVSLRLFGISSVVCHVLGILDPPFRPRCWH